MNANIARALLKDAFYQVLDNKVFRLLAIVSACLVLPAFIVAFREDGIDVLFGWQHLDYASVNWLFRLANPSGKDAYILAIQRVEALFSEGILGNFGILFCIAATAFFIPRMLEKGTADTLFSKPVSRFTLLLARYAAGILFVATLSFALVGGIYTGVLVRSGYSDTGFLWSALTLTYVFALVHSVSTIVGVFSRSSVTALLVTIVFFSVNGCVHASWMGKEYLLEQMHVATDAKAGDGDASDKPDIESLNPLWTDFVFPSLDALHYVLPKTSDADALVAKLRAAVGGTDAVLLDAEGELSITRPPQGFARTDAAKADATHVDLDSSPATWVAIDGGREVARIVVSRRTRLVESASASHSARRKSASSAASEYSKALDGRSEITAKPVKVRTPTTVFSVEHVRWTETTPTGTVARDHAILPSGDWFIEVDATLDSHWLDPDARTDRVHEFIEHFKSTQASAAGMDPKQWYAQQLGLSSRWKMNIFFSVLTSLLFTAAMLYAARWRLMRIDF